MSRPMANVIKVPLHAKDSLMARCTAICGRGQLKIGEQEENNTRNITMPPHRVHEHELVSVSGSIFMQSFSLGASTSEI